MKVSRSKDKTMTEVGGGGFTDDWPEPGHYQFYVTGIEVQPDKLKNMIIVGLEVVTGEVPGQEGKKPDLLLWYDPEHDKWSQNSMDRIARFFWACGIIEDEEEADLEPADAVGRSFIGKVVKTKRKKSKDDPTKVDVIQMEDGGYWRIGHPDIEGLVKVDQEVAKAGAEKKTTEKAGDAVDDDLGDL